MAEDHDQTLAIKVQNLDESNCKALIGFTGEINIDCATVNKNATTYLSSFSGTSLKVKLLRNPDQDTLVILARALDNLSRARGDEISIDVEIDCDFEELPLDSLRLFEFVHHNYEFEGFDFRGSSRYWPENISGSYVHFDNCQWDVESLQALRGCANVDVAGFCLDDPSEEILREVGRMQPLTRLEVDLGGKPDVNAVRMLSAEINNVVLALLPSLSKATLEALAECRGGLEIYHGDLLEDERVLIGNLSAARLDLFDCCVDEQLLEGLARGSASEINLECQSEFVVSATKAKHIVAWCDRVQRQSLKDAVFSIRRGRLTRRAREILLERIGTNGRLWASGDYIRIDVDLC